MARPRSDIDLRILHAARALFLSEGVDGASLRAIARAARTNLGMISYYFASKDDLFLAVVEEVYAKLLRDLEDVLALPMPLADRLRRVSIRLGTMTDDEVAVVRLVVREALLSSKRFRRLLSRFKRGHISLLVSSLTRAVQDGEVDGATPVPLMLGGLFGTIALPQLIRRVAAADLPFPLPGVEETAELGTRVLFRGVGGDGVAEPRRAGPRRKTRARARKA